MTFVPFFLTVNLTVACLFVLTFAFVSIQERNQRAPRWFTLTFAALVLLPLFGFWIEKAAYPELVGVCAFTALLTAVISGLVGVHEIYRMKVDWPLLALLAAASLALNLVLLELPRSTLLHRILYQAPFCLFEAWMMRTVYRSGMPRLVDKLLMALATLALLHFLSRPFLILWVGVDVRQSDGTGAASAMFSLTMGVLVQVGFGLSLLLLSVSRMVGDANESSEIDELSQICNRRGFDRRVGRILAGEGPDAPYAVIMSDLDHFKQVNDTFGHDGGDRIIAAFGRLMKGQLPRASVAARMGGEEFVAFLPHVDLDAARGHAQQLRRLLSELDMGQAAHWRPTASFGVAVHAEGEGLYETMRRADRALYAAKKEGRDRVRAWRAEDEREARIA